LALAGIIFAVVLGTLGKYLFPVRSEATPCKASE
ncbi:EamA family transporter, partial [Klebsiella pneumoniae]|nr:EamA family transporter [Klebsiella pneumoniae]